MIEFVCTAPLPSHIRKNRNMGCHGNHTFSYSPNEFIFENIFLFVFRGPREQFGINEKLSWGVRCDKLDTGVQRHIEYIEIAICILA